MKSIIEEASSIAKAVESGWQKAGKPKEFTVKIFEEAKRNFFGLTTQSAKVGIFFNSTQEVTEQPVKQQPVNKSTQKRSIQTESNQRVHIKQTVSNEKQPLHNQLNSSEPVSIEWTTSMASIGAEWLKSTLQAVHKSDVTFEYTINGPLLNFILQGVLAENTQEEKHLFASFSTLILQAIKKKTRKSLKGYRVSVSRQK